MKLLLILTIFVSSSSFTFVLGDEGGAGGDNIQLAEHDLQTIPFNNMPHTAYSGFGAYGGLGFAGPFHGRPLHGLRPGLKCLGTELQLTETLNQTMKNCHDKVYTDWETSGKTGIPPVEKRACGIVCTAQGIGLLDKYGRPNNDGIAEHIQKVYPREVVTQLTEAIIECGNKYGKEVTIKDGSCDSFEELVSCVKSNVRRICHVPRLREDNSLRSKKPKLSKDQ